MGPPTALLLALVISGSCWGAATPKFKWWQDHENLYLSIDVKKCAGASGVAQIQPTDFQWSCQGILDLAFTIREEVDPSRSSCKPMEESARVAEEICTLRKAHAHYFDRLTFDKSPGLRKFMSADWTRMKISKTEHVPYQEPYEAEGELIPSLTADQLLQMQSEHLVVAADINYPWCNHQVLAANLLKAARKLRRNSKVAVVFINAVEERHLAKTYNITCRMKPVLHVFRQGEPMYLLEGAFSQDSKTISKAIKSFVVPAAKLVNTQAELTAISKNHSVVVGFVPKDADVNPFLSAARMLERKYEIKSALASDDLASSTEDAMLRNTKSPTLALFTDGAEKAKVVQAVKSASSWSGASITEWGLIHTLPAVTEYRYSLRQKLGETKLPMVQVWANASHAQKLNELAEQHRGKLVFTQMSDSEAYRKSEFGFGEKDTSKAIGLGILKTFEFDDKERYGFHGDDLHSDNLPQFFEDFLEGKLKPSLKSLVQTAPAVNGYLNVAVATGLSDMIRKKSLVLVLYKPYSKQWKEIEEMLEDVATVLKGVESVQLAKIDTSNNGIDTELFPSVDEHHRSIPVFLCTSDQSGTANASELQIAAGDIAMTASEQANMQLTIMRTNLLIRLKDKVPEVAEKWETIGVALKQLLSNEFSVEKARLKAQEKKMANARKVKVADGIVKYVFTESSELTESDMITIVAPLPKPGDLITAHYTGTLEDGTKFDSSVDRKEPFQFTLGQGQVIKCWDAGFATMGKGEKAQLKCDSENAYGHRGSPPKIPGGATLLFDVELIDFESKAKVEL